MIVVTGAAGFIGSCLIGYLNEQGYKDVVAVDKFTYPQKEKNLEGKTLSQRVERNKFHGWLNEHHKLVQFIFHIGARTDTAEFDTAVLEELNVEYSKRVWTDCVKFGIPLVYASSAATYGSGEFGYDDSHEVIEKLHPLNPYGVSKNEFDKWALAQNEKPYFWVGLKFFNVFGPNEYHKKRMASVVYHAFNQIKATGKMQLFASHNPDYKDGEQKRDFIYVKDVVKICEYLMIDRMPDHSGLYNVGTGQANTFLSLAEGVFEALGKEPDISFIDTPEDIRDKYQYYTQANMFKLRSIGYGKPFTAFKDAIKDYVRGYLQAGTYY